MPSFGLPYSSPSWPKDADRDHYVTRARRSYPNASDDKIEQLAAASAMIDRGSKDFVSVTRAVVVDGEAVSPVEADKLRALAPRRKLGCRFDREAA